MFLVTFEAKDGTWLDDPMGFDSSKEAVEEALKEWESKLGPGDAIVLYSCHQEDILAEGPEKEDKKTS